MAMRIALFGLPHSPNLGDGVIADCLAFAVRRAAPGAEVRAIDLSGRRARGDVTVRNRALAIRALGAMPRALRERVVVSRLTRLLDRVAPEWEAAVRGADLAILGGGQLFSDADLNFPVKVARACEVVARHRVPLAIHAVGVARNWSPRGAALFARAGGADLRRVGLRDDYSAGAWRAQMPAGVAVEPVIARDPGLLAAACYGPAERPGERLGVCVTAPEIVAYHSEPGGRGDALGLLEGVALALVERGHAVTLFTNGAAEDEAALARLAARAPLARRIDAGAVEVAEAPRTPAELARLVAGLRGLVAHRLHACILGYAYALPVVGLGWDRKVESFFASVGASRHFVGAAGAGAGPVAARLDRALAEGVDAVTHARVVAEAGQAVERALAAAGPAARAATAG